MPTEPYNATSEPLPFRLEILHLEDDSDHATLMLALLQRTPSLECEVTLARTLEEAEKLLSSRPFDLVLADLHLPDGGPEDTLRRLLPVRGAAPLVAVTGSSSAGLGPHAVAHGAQDFLPKAVLDPEYIERALRFAIEREQLAHRLRKRTNDLKELLDLARNELTQRLEAIANNCSELEERAMRTAIPSHSSWFRDTERFARETRKLVQNLHEHFDPSAGPLGRTPSSLSVLHEIPNLDISAAESDLALEVAIPAPALLRAISTLVDAAPGARCKLDIAPSRENQGRIRLELTGDSMLIEARGNLSADLYREALSLELALALRLARFSLKNHEGDAWVEIRDNGQFRVHVEVPAAEGEKTP